MQRRAAKGQAKISPPQPSSMGSEYDKPSRLNQRNFGVTNRIWIILAVFLSLLVFTHYALPAHQLPTRKLFSSENLHAKNYINASEAEPNPFAFCPAYGPGDEIGAKYGALTLSQSRLHLGSGARVQRVLNRALFGEPVTISILGGSVSSCHGAGDDPIAPDCYPSRFFQWWNSVFPHPATELTNGAMRRTNSGYYGFCSAHHLPEVTDLVILELDVDDAPGEDAMNNFELLVRALLLRPDQPAVLILGHFSPQVHETYGFAGPDHWHNVVAQFYDVPHISIKSALYPDYMKDPTSIKKYYVDPILAGPTGHEVLSDVLIAYLQSQICIAWAVATGQAYDTVPLHTSEKLADTPGIYGGVGLRKGVIPEHENHPHLDSDGDHVREGLAGAAPGGIYAQLRVPTGRINTRPNHPVEEIAPFCVSAHDLINPLPPSLFYGSGWQARHPPPGEALQTAAHYWYSTLPLSRLRIPMQIGAGDIGIYYLQEPIANIGEGSAVECWVDDNYAGAKVIENAADVGDATPALEIIDHFVTRGSHFVECQLMGEEGEAVPAFKIIGIFST